MNIEKKKSVVFFSDEKLTSDEIPKMQKKKFANRKTYKKNEFFRKKNIINIINAINTHISHINTFFIRRSLLLCQLKAFRRNENSFETLFDDFIFGTDRDIPPFYTYTPLFYTHTLLFLMHIPPLLK